MEVAKLEGEVRTDFGKIENKKLINRGSVPIVIQGLKKDNTFASVNAQQLNRVFKSKFGRNVIVELTLKNGDKDVKETVISHIIEEHAIRDHIIHADFTRVDMSKPVAATIPVHLSGESPGAKAGGILIHKLKEANIEALANEIPEEIIVDISELKIDTQIQLQEIQDKYGFTFTDDPLSVIARVESPKEAEEEPVEKEDGEEGGEGAEGEKAAEGSSDSQGDAEEAKE